MPVRLNGSTSGYVELAAPAVAGTTSLELPTDSIKPGLVLVAAQSFSAASSVSVNNCFSATYDNYRIVLRAAYSAAGANLHYRLRASGTDDTSANYVRQLLQASGTSVGASAATQTFAEFGAGHSTSAGNVLAMDVFSPYAAAVTNGLSLWHRSDTFCGLFSTLHVVSSSYDGITIYPASGTITGTVRVYGYRNSL